LVGELATSFHLSHRSDKGAASPEKLRHIRVAQVPKAHYNHAILEPF